MAPALLHLGAAWCLVALCCVALAPRGGAAAQAAPDARAAELATLRDRSADRVIRLDETTYRTYAGGAAKRLYALIVFFDAMQLHEHAELGLKASRREFALAAAAFAKRNSAANGNASRLFFADAEFQQAQNLYRRFNYTTVPHVRFIEGKDEEADRDLDLGRSKLSAEGVAAYLKLKGIDIGPIPRPPPVSPAVMGAIAAATVISAPFVIRYLLQKKTIFHDPRWWCLSGLSIYFFSVSGGMYNIIRGMPMMTASQAHPGKFEYFYKGSGTQLGVEGFVVGSLYSLVGLLLAFATFVLPRLKPGTTQRVLMYACIGGSYLAVRQVLSLHEWKQGYWAHAYWPKRWLK